MLVVGRLSNRMPLLGLACAIGPTSLPPPLNVSPISKASSYLLVYHTLNSAAAMSPRTPSSCTASSLFLSIVRPTCTSCSYPSRVLLASLAPCSCSLICCVPTCAVGRVARLCWCWWCRCAPQVGPHRAKVTHERDLCSCEALMSQK
jgi:hypothetical protein